MLLTEIDHIAIAVKDLEAAIDYYQRAFGAEVHHREIVESDGVEEALVKVADSYIQLTAATRPDSPIAKAIEKRGEGLHHVGYRVDNCAEALASMIAAGATAIDQAPRPAAVAPPWRSCTRRAASAPSSSSSRSRTDADRLSVQPGDVDADDAIGRSGSHVERGERQTRDPSGLGDEGVICRPARDARSLEQLEQWHHSASRQRCGWFRKGVCQCESGQAGSIRRGAGSLVSTE